MIKYKISIDKKTLEFLNREQAEKYCLNNDISFEQIFEVIMPSVVADNYLLINNRIQFFQSVAPQLTKELYVENTLAGISTPQSDQMFDDFADVLTRIKEGAFPTALYRLSQNNQVVLLLKL